MKNSKTVKPPVRKGAAQINVKVDNSAIPPFPYVGGGVQVQSDKYYPTKADAVNHPPHYCAHPSGVECITVTEHMNFNLGNAVKYIWRNEGKGGIEDLRKAVWYIEREITRVSK